MLLLVHRSALTSILATGEATHVGTAVDVEARFVEMCPSDRLEVPGGIESPSAIVILDRDHRLHFSDATVDDRPSLYRASFRRCDGVWKAASEGCVSPRVLDAPDSDLVFIAAPETMPPQDALLGYWAGMLVAGGRAGTSEEALSRARDLVAEHDLTAESTQPLRTAADEMIQDFVARAPY